MKTVEMVRRLDSVIEKLRTRELLAFLQERLSPPPSVPDVAIHPNVRAEFASLVFQSNVALSRLQDEPGNAEVLSAFGIFEVFAPDRLAKMITVVNTSSAVSQLRSGAEGFFLFREFEIRLANLLQVRGALESLVVEPRMATVPKDESVLELQITDIDDNGVLASRLAAVLVYLDELHAAINALHPDSGRESTDLRIAYSDSGSDILLALQGHEKTLGLIGGAFAWMWAQLRFARNANLERDFESISKGLEVLSLVEQKRVDKILDDSTAKRLRSTIMTRMQKLVESGVTLPDAEPEETIDPALLIREVAQPKRLASGKTNEANE